MGSAGVSAGGGGLVWTDPDIANASYDSVSFSVASQQSNSQGITFKADGTKFYVVSSSQGVIYAYDLSTAWDVSTASYNSENFDASSQDSAVTDLIFKPDGTKMYVVGRTNDNVYQYSLSTAFDVSTASYDSKSVSVASQETTPEGVTFKSDGTSLYVVGRINDDIFQYDMTTAWDVSTASYANKSVSLATGDPYALFMNPNDDQIYYSDNTDFIYVYDLGTVGDISTASFNSSFSVSSQSGSPRGFTFKPDGSKMYVLDYFNNTVFQYTTPAAVVSWTDPDIANASYDSVSFATSGLTACTGLQFNPNGTKMYVAAFTGGVKEHNLSTVWDASTASASGNSIAVANAQSLHFKPDGTVIFVGSGSDIIEYPLSTAYDLSTAGSATTTSFSATLSFVRGLSFNDDGSKLYTLDSSVLYEHSLSTNYDVSTSTGSTNVTLNNDCMDLYFDPNGYYAYIAVGNAGSTNASSIIEYTLTTAFDISTLNTTPTSTFSTSSQETDPQGLAFKSDGSKMFVVGTANNTVYQYTTPAASSWTDPDLTNASYDSVSFSASTQVTNSRGLSFKSDGTKVYVVGSATNIIYAYDLSTAWDVSTAAYNSENGSVNSQDTNTNGLVFKPDGTKLYIIGDTNDTVYQYSLSTAWNVSTLSYDNKSISVASQDTIPTDITFKSDGTSFYITGKGNDDIYQYDMTTAYDISTASYSNKSFNLISTNALGIFMNPNDDQIYYSDGSTDLVYAYDLSTAGDISTASLNSSFSVNTQSAAPQGVSFKSDGSKMYVIDFFSETIYQYST